MSVFSPFLSCFTYYLLYVYCFSCCTHLVSASSPHGQLFNNNNKKNLRWVFFFVFFTNHLITISNTQFLLFRFKFYGWKISQVILYNRIYTLKWSIFLHCWLAVSLVIEVIQPDAVLNVIDIEWANLPSTEEKKDCLWWTKFNTFAIYIFT